MKGYRDRLRAKRFRREVTTINPEDLKQNGLLKERYVKKSSVVYKRASLYKALNDKIINEMYTNNELTLDSDNNVTVKSRRPSKE
jgi:hypothetical protein